MKRLFFILLIGILGSSCQPSSKEINRVQLVQDYIQALDESDYHRITALFKDSIRMRELEYVSAFSKEAYHAMFQWDSTFHPTYQLLDIREDSAGVRMQVSKICTRIRFLNEEPNITEELVRFQDGKITSVEIQKYIVFNDDKWTENRAKLVSWVEENHPELNGFLIDQSKQGALNYLKAIELYQQSEKQE